MITKHIYVGALQVLSHFVIIMTRRDPRILSILERVAWEICYLVLDYLGKIYSLPKFTSSFVN